MKKLLTILLLGIFLISFTSALEVDNHGFYNETTKTIIVKNACIPFTNICLGDEIGGAQLNTPQIYHVAPGYKKVAEFDLWAYEDYNDVIKNLNLYDKNYQDWGNHELTKEVDIKFKSYENVSVNDYENVITGYSENGTSIYESQITGSHEEEREVWKKVTPTDLKKNNRLTMGIFADVEIGDKVEWVLELYGVPVQQWAVWTADLNVDLISYYKLEDTDNTNVTDSQDNFTGTQQGVTNEATGLILDGFEFAGGGEYFTTGEDTTFDFITSSTFTFSFWVQPDTWVNSDRLLSTDDGTNGYQCIATTGNKVQCWGNGGGIVESDDTVTVDGSTWNHIVWTWDAGNTTIYINGDVTTPTSGSTTAVASTEDLEFGRSSDAIDTTYDGVMDEISIYNRVLSPAEITQLYNNGSGITWTDTFFGIITTLNTPLNDTIINDNLVNFNFTITPTGLNITNYTLTSWFSNGTLEHQHINTTIFTDQEVTIIHNDTLFFDESYIWNVESCGNDGVTTSCDTSANWTFTIDTIPPVVNITYPIEGFVVDNPSQNITLNYTITHDTPIVNCFYNTTSNSTPINISCTLNTTSLLYPVGNPGNLTIYVFGNDTASNIGSDNVTIYKDVDAPTISIDAPTGILNYNYIGNNETLNVTFTDTNLDSCWYDYNGTNVTIVGCLTGVKNSTLFILENNYNMTIYANDSLGNENSSFIEWSYNLTEISQTYPTTAVESSTQTYTSTLLFNSSTFGVITGVLTLNGTEYTGTRSGSENNAIFSADAIMPSVSAETNFTAYWTIGLTDTTSTTDFNLTSNNVTVSIINLSLCDAINNVSFWNFTIYNETNIVELNSTFEITFGIKSVGSSEVNSFSFSDATENNSQYDFCISPGTQSYIADANIKLTKSGYVDKFYNYEEISLSNSTREDSLYMMTTGDSTSFIVHVVYVDSSDVSEAEVQVQRYYQGTGLWLTTEILTTNYIGEAVGHLLSEDADYRFLVYKNGVSLYNSSATKITCTVAPCTVTLTIPISVASGTETVDNLESTLIYSDVINTFTYTYSDTSGDFSLARLYVSLVWPSNATAIVLCNDTKSTASGVMTCDISSGINGTYRASGYITRTSDEFLDKQLSASLGTRIYNSMGLDGVLWGFFILMAVAMIGITRPSLSIIFSTVGLIVLSVLGIINIGALSIIAVSSIAIVLLMRIGRE